MKDSLKNVLKAMPANVRNRKHCLCIIFHDIYRFWYVLIFCTTSFFFFFLMRIKTLGWSQFDYGCVLANLAIRRLANRDCFRRRHCRKHRCLTNVYFDLDALPYSYLISVGQTTFSVGRQHFDRTKILYWKVLERYYSILIYCLT